MLARQSQCALQGTTIDTRVRLLMFDLDMQRTRVEIGKRIRRLRLEKDLTQGDLAAALGHSSSTRINQIELGRLRLYAEELPRLCDRLGCALTDIVDE